MTLNNLNFENIRAYYGGIWNVASYLITTPFTANDITITNSISYNQGGVAYILGSTTNTWTFTTVTVNTCESTNN